MTNLFLQRLVEKKDRTLGVLYLDDTPRFWTLELPWKNNEQQKSCIPIGTYKVKYTKDRKTLGGTRIDATYEVLNVPARSGILFHAGNLPRDTKGCILIGKSIDNSGDLIESRKAMAEFIAEMDAQDESLLVVRKGGI